ncbi:hypothetical protein ACLOJK_014269 [Asimina triloba]
MDRERERCGRQMEMDRDPRETGIDRDGDRERSVRRRDRERDGRGRQIFDVPEEDRDRHRTVRMEIDEEGD